MHWTAFFVSVIAGYLAHRGINWYMAYRAAAPDPNKPKPGLWREALGTWAFDRLTNPRGYYSDGSKVRTLDQVCRDIESREEAAKNKRPGNYWDNW